MPEGSPREITLFYSWQSDRDEQCCKRFVRIAAEEAAAAVSLRMGITLTIDADTEGVSGTPPVNETILAKIEASDLFLADVSFVGETTEGKLLPNPNVMAEYGYALRAKTTRRILLVMNTAFGPPDALPFDLKHQRWPAQYALATGAPDAERRASRKRLAQTLDRNFTAAVEKILKGRPTAKSDRWGEAQEMLIGFASSQVTGQQPVIVSKPRLLVHAVPLSALDAPHLSPSTVKAARGLFLPNSDVRIVEGQDETQWWTFEVPRRVPDRPNTESDWCFRLARPGVFEVAVNIGRRIDDDPDIGVEGAEIERLLVSAVARIAKVCDAVGLGRDTLLTAHLEGIDDVAIHRSAPGSGGRRIRKPFASLGQVRLEPSLRPPPTTSSR